MLWNEYNIMTRRLKELLGDLVSQLKSCTNREYFQAKREALIDPVSEPDELEVADVPVDE